MHDIKIAELFLRKKQSSKSRGIEFDLSFTAFKNMMRAKKCFFTRVALTDPTSSIQKPTDRTIDRLDCNKGYVHGNVVACCFAANQLKAAIESSDVKDKKAVMKIAKFAIQKQKV